MRKTRSFEREIEALESEWFPDSGFFWRIRQGRFAADEFQCALKRVSAISIEQEVDLPRRFVSLRWYIPLFMQWQAERVQENGGDTAAYTKAMTTMTNEIERLLGVP